MEEVDASLKAIGLAVEDAEPFSLQARVAAILKEIKES